MTTHYDTLGITKEASSAEIKQAYRTLSLKWHPDRNSSPEAHAKFQEINAAYEILGDEDRKSQYDAEQSGVFMRSDGIDGFDMENLGGFFNMMFGSGIHEIHLGPGGPNIHVFHGMPGGAHFFQQIQKPPPIIKNIQIDIVQAYTGCTIHVEIEKWVIRDNVRVNESEIVYVNVPQGIDQSEVIIMRDIGNTINEHLKGDVKFVVQIYNNTNFQRHGMDLVYKKTISLKEALTGFSFELVHLSGKKLCLKNHSSKTIISPNYKKTISNLGMVRDGNTGVLIIEFDIVFPESLTDEQVKSLSEIL
jgi:DnaJ-class molecular chaperone